MIKNGKNTKSISKIIDFNSKAFLEAMELYEELFPPEERKSITDVKNLLNSGVYELYGLSGAEDIVIGFALVMSNNDPEFLLIDNIAIDSQFQGSGLGSFFIKELSRKQNNTAKGILIEVEKPELAVDESDYMIRSKRLEFYYKLGFSYLEGIDYLFPVKGEDPIPLLLMFLPIAGVKSLSADIIRKMIKSVYTNIHKGIDNLDEIFRYFENTITDQVFE